MLTRPLLRRHITRWHVWTAAACLALFVLASCVTVHWHPFAGSTTPPSKARTEAVLSLVGGCARVYVWRTDAAVIQYDPGLSIDPRAPVKWLGDLHLGGDSVNRGPGRGQYIVAVPLWMPAGVLMGLWAWGLRRREGRCRECGYDLRGLAAGAGCPECGSGA